MVYDRRWKQFCEVLYRIVKGKGIRFLSGSQNQGQVTCGETVCGKYCPSRGNFNFAIPSISVLSKSSDGLPSHIHPGILQPTLDLPPKNKQLCLAVDGKRLTQGLGAKNLGDVNLWGLKGPPSLCERNTHHEKLKEMVQTIHSHIDLELAIEVVLKLRDFLAEFSNLVKNLCKKQLQRRKQLANLEKKKSANPDTQNKFALAISSIKAYLLWSQNIITHLLVMNKQKCCALSNIQLTPYCFSTGDHVSLNRQVNTRLLYPVDVVSRFFDPHTFTHLVQQNSYLWPHLCQQARITGSTAYNALGLRTKKLLDEHYNHYINKVPQQPKEPSVQEKLDYGRRNEINVLATLSGLFMPALLPNCATLYEEGPNFLHSTQVHNFMEVSPDGFMGTCSMDECYQPCSISYDSWVVEVKCPFPNDE